MDGSPAWEEDRADYTILKPTEKSHLLTAIAGMLDMAFLTSDLAQQWDEPAADFVRRYWNERGSQVPAAIRVRLAANGLPEAAATAYDEGHHAVGVYNRENGARDTAVRLDDLRIPGTADDAVRLDSFGDERVVLRNGVLTVMGQPGGSLRVVRLERSGPAHP